MEENKQDKKWWQIRKMSRNEYGKTTLVGLLGGYLIGGIVGDVVTIAGLVCGIVWIYLKITKKT